MFFYGKLLDELCWIGTNNKMDLQRSIRCRDVMGTTMVSVLLMVLLGVLLIFPADVELSKSAPKESKPIKNVV